MAADPFVRTAAVLFAVNGLGFGIPAIIGMRSLATGHGVAMVMGFPAYGGGPFERMGLKSTVGLLTVFLLVCLLEVGAAFLLWNGAKAGAILGLAILLPGAVFWWGFALPIPPILATAWTSLLIWKWNTLG